MDGGPTIQEPAARAPHPFVREVPRSVGRGAHSRVGRPRELVAGARQASVSHLRGRPAKSSGRCERSPRAPAFADTGSARRRVAGDRVRALDRSRARGSLSYGCQAISRPFDRLNELGVQYDAVLRYHAW